jgi:hypothetical protein
MQLRNGKTRLKGISTDTELIYRYARKAYRTELLKRMNRAINLLDHACRKVPDLSESAVLAAMPKHYDLLDPARVTGRYTDGSFQPNPSIDGGLWPAEPALDTCGLEPEEWGAMPYAANASYMEDLKYRASNGALYRSKSEVVVAEVYAKLGIYYHYDESIVINGEYLAPDFCGCRLDGTLVYHEHFGRHDTDYALRNAHKMHLYALAGIVLGKNLLFTYDDEYGGIDSELIEAMVRDIYRL